MEKRHEEISTISSYLFCVWKDDSTKTRIQIPARQYCGPLRIRRQAEHTGKSCSRLELVVRECGLMLQGMVSVFLFDCLAFYESAEFVPIFPGKSGRKIRSLYRDSWRPFCQSCIPAGIFAIYMTDGTENPSMEFPDFLLHTFILHKHPFFTTFLKNFTLMCR